MEGTWKKIAVFGMAVLVPVAAMIFTAARADQQKTNDEAGKAESKMGPGFQSTATETESIFPETNYQWLTHYMHQVYERYVQARRAFDNGETELAQANLYLMEVYAENSQEKLPDTLQNGKPFDKKKYVDTIATMKEYSADIRKNIEQGKWHESPPGKLDPVLQTCVGCHSAYDIPTAFELGTTFKKMTRLIHEVYELYRLSGKVIRGCKGKEAKQCRETVRCSYLAVMPYIDAIPSHVPERNQDGEPIPPEVFKRTYEKLRRYNRKSLRAMEDKKQSFKEPAPPPDILRQSCYTCHAESLDIPQPWLKTPVKSE